MRRYCISAVLVSTNLWQLSTCGKFLHVKPEAEPVQQAAEVMLDLLPDCMS